MGTMIQERLDVVSSDPIWRSETPRRFVPSSSGEIIPAISYDDDIDTVENKTRHVVLVVSSGVLSRSSIVPISTMAPYDKLEVIKPFNVTIQPYEDEFRADFLDANLSAFGATTTEAVWNLKDIIADTFEDLSRHENGRLGRGLMRQLAVLKAVIRERV
jgi:hypothetical protein